jgi:hypothetical protein
LLESNPSPLFYSLVEVGILLYSTGLLSILLLNAMILGCALLVIKGLEEGRRDSHEVFDVVPLLAEVWSLRA